MSRADNYHLDERSWTRGRNVIVFIALAAIAGSLIGWLGNAKQFAASYLVNYMFFTTIALGALFFVMVQHMTGSAWSVTVRRMMENIMVTIPAAALLFVPIGLNIPLLYEWSHKEFYSNDAVMQFKMNFFNPGFFLARMAAYFIVWTVLALNLYRHSVAQDGGGSLERIRKISWWSAPGLLAAMITVTSASVDLLMSLEPHWYSTIFGIYIYSGGALAFMAALTLICILLRRAGLLVNTINLEHYHDLGKWLFALTIFWAYIAFSQYLLIWYANIPEETIWYKERMHGNWIWISALLLVGHFIVPFVVLLARAGKRNLNVLAAISIWILLMHYVDLHWVVMPTLDPHQFHLHWLDGVTFLAVGGIYAFVFWGRLRRRSLVAAGDLRFEQSLHFKNV